MLLLSSVSLQRLLQYELIFRLLLKVTVDWPRECNSIQFMRGALLSREARSQSSTLAFVYTFQLALARHPTLATCERSQRVAPRITPPAPHASESAAQAAERRPQLPPPLQGQAASRKASTLRRQTGGDQEGRPSSPAPRMEPNFGAARNCDAVALLKAVAAVMHPTPGRPHAAPH